MTFSVTISNKNDEEKWNSLLSNHKSSTAYQTVNWSSIYQNHFNSKPVYLTVQNSNKKIVGQLSALIHSDYIWRNSNFLSKKISKSLKLGSYLYWNYGPIIHDDKNFDQILSIILENIVEFAKKNNISFIRGSFSPLGKTPNKEILKKLGFEIKNWKTYIIDLTKNSDELYASLDKKTRYDIRKIKKTSLQMDYDNNKKSLYDYAYLSIESRKVKGEKRKLDLPFFDLAGRYLQENDLLNVSLAKDGAETLSGIWNIAFNGNLVQQGVENVPKSKLAGTFITWKTIEQFTNSKNLTYDMGGANPNPQSQKEKQINFYKSKWGGIEIGYFIITKKIKEKDMKVTSLLANPRKVTLKIKKIIHKT